MAKAYCFKCRKKVEIKKPTRRKLKTGAVLTKGTDSKGHKVSVIGRG